ncbi:hypothetical protein KL941_005222 [Ogataea angusta]|nr:hypothetical protein KL941_005222 [Ogataea angusta]
MFPTGIVPSVEPFPALDAITWKSLIYKALSKLHGITGTAVQYDILKIQGQRVYIRVPADEAHLLSSALTVSAPDLSLLDVGQSAAFFNILATGPTLMAIAGPDRFSWCEV